MLSNFVSSEMWEEEYCEQTLCDAVQAVREKRNIRCYILFNSRIGLGNTLYRTHIVGIRVINFSGLSPWWWVAESVWHPSCQSSRIAFLEIWRNYRGAANENGEDVSSWDDDDEDEEADDPDPDISRLKTTGTLQVEVERATPPPVRKTSRNIHLCNPAR